MILTAYQENWKPDFESIAQVLKHELRHLNVFIEHIGSTAIPGLAAKPIIDIDLVFTNMEFFEKVKDGLLLTGYYHNGDQGISGREVFKRQANFQHPILDKMKHHLYVCNENNEELRRHLLFRNYLKTHPEASNEYAKMKHRIAAVANQDRKIYASLKEIDCKIFINETIKKAEDHFANRQI